mmetsp:Transcript_4572/g.11811  ORF Transcript_4572/g.11811 Transcript_4572/m.11811 type:complete len:356 (-) Transcript_4572:430-1497(-)
MREPAGTGGTLLGELWRLASSAVLERVGDSSEAQLFKPASRAVIRMPSNEKQPAPTGAVLPGGRGADHAQARRGIGGVALGMGGLYGGPHPRAGVVPHQPRASGAQPRHPGRLQAPQDRPSMAPPRGLPVPVRGAAAVRHSGPARSGHAADLAGRCAKGGCFQGCSAATVRGNVPRPAARRPRHVGPCLVPRPGGRGAVVRLRRAQLLPHAGSARGGARGRTRRCLRCAGCRHCGRNGRPAGSATRAHTGGGPGRNDGLHAQLRILAAYCALRPAGGGLLGRAGGGAALQPGLRRGAPPGAAGDDDGQRVPYPQHRVPARGRGGAGRRGPQHRRRGWRRGPCGGMGHPGRLHAGV